MGKLWVTAVAGRRIETQRGLEDEIVGLELTGFRRPGDAFADTETIVLNPVIAAKVIHGLQFMFAEAGRGEELARLIEKIRVEDHRPTPGQG